MTSSASLALTTALTFINATATNGSAAETIKKMWLIVSPILLVVGLVGNSLVMVTMTRQVMSGTSTCVYLVAMATLDIGVLLFGLIPEWLAGASITDLREIHPVMCELIRFLKYVFVDSSIWARVLFTVDRCVAVHRPLNSSRYFGRVTSSRKYVIVAVIANCALNVHEFFMRGAQYRTQITLTRENNNSSSLIVTSTSLLVSNCGSPTSNAQYFDLYIRPWLAFVFASTIPFIIIVIANATIIFSLARHGRRLLNSRHFIVATIVRAMTGRTVPDDPLRQVTLMCFATSALFLLCTAPGIILLIGKVKWSLPNGANLSYEIARVANNLFFYVMFAGNFFLYCLTAKKFRSTLRSVCCLGNPPRMTSPPCAVQLPSPSASNKISLSATSSTTTSVSQMSSTATCRIAEQEVTHIYQNI